MMAVHPSMTPVPTAICRQSAGSMLCCAHVYIGSYLDSTRREELRTASGLSRPGRSIPRYEILAFPAFVNAS